MHTHQKRFENRETFFISGWNNKQSLATQQGDLVDNRGLRQSRLKHVRKEKLKVGTNISMPTIIGTVISCFKIAVGEWCFPQDLALQIMTVLTKSRH